MMVRFSLDKENELLLRLANGDEGAFKIIFENYVQKMLIFAQSYVKSEAEAEEITQEVFLKLWLRDRNALPINNLDGYFKTLVRNRCLDVLRKRALENHADLQHAINWKENHNDTEELIILNDTRKILDEGINLLPPQQKQVYKLCHQDGLKYNEVAKMLNLSTGTVQTHMKLALRFLRGYMQQHTDIAALIVIFKLLH